MTINRKLDYTKAYTISMFCGLFYSLIIPCGFFRPNVGRIPLEYVGTTKLFVIVLARVIFLEHNCLLSFLHLTKLKRYRKIEIRHFVCSDQVFTSISELIDLARWIKFDPCLIPRLALIVLSGTEFNRGINFNPELARVNPRIALVVFARPRPWDLEHYLRRVFIQDNQANEGKPFNDFSFISLY